jgi:hypothetical protein
MGRNYQAVSTHNYMWDSTQDVTRSFGVISPPIAFLIDSDGIIRY